MKVVTHDDFLGVYVNDPAAAPGRIEPILEALKGEAVFEEAYPASGEDVEAVHTASHIARVNGMGLYNISTLAAGGAVLAAEIGMEEPCFAVIRPPGHHASSDSSWGFCYFNNMAVAIDHLKREGRIKTAYILDFDLHYGDGTVSILRERGYVAIHNPDAPNRQTYLGTVEANLAEAQADVIAVSAGFDNHQLDWGGLLTTEDYHSMGRMVYETCQRLNAGCFAVLEGGYNHSVIGKNALAFVRGLQGK